MTSMDFFLRLLAEKTSTHEPAIDSVTLESYLTPGFVILCTIGLCILIVWYLYSGRHGALHHAPIRRYRGWFMLWPVIILFSWNIGLSLIFALISAATGTDMKDIPDLTQNLVTAVVYSVLITMMLYVAHKAFARQLNGFGINLRTLLPDIGSALITLLALFPLIQFGQIIVLVMGQWLYGDYEIQQHQTLTFLAENHNTMLMILTITNAVFIIPVFEEMLFRGFLQSTLRGAITPWKAIVITSLFFSFIHYPYFAHMPALFFLSCGLGYAYERSGSLLRPILMHMFFNGFSITLVLMTGS